MKRVTLVAIGLFYSGIIVFASNLPVNKAVSDTTKTKSKKVEVQYTCGMHPDVTSNKPGRCPKCGMGLIQKDTVKMKR
jgi:predicted Zn-ribbon and HTH transcriptional regulator